MNANTLPFPELSKRQSLPEELAAAIMQQVEAGEVKVGDVLPSEQALARMFQVSRTVVREALARLKFDGIIESKRGSGPMVISTVPLNNLSLSVNQSTPAEKALIIEFRLIMEGESAALAAARRTEAQLKEMHNCLNLMQSAMNKNEAGTLPDFRFHTLIAESAHNDYISQFIQFFFAKMIAGVHAARSLSNQDYQRAKEVFNEHKAVYDAIKASNPRQARLALQHHLLSSANRQNIPLSGPLRYICHDSFAPGETNRPLTV